MREQTQRLSNRPGTEVQSGVSQGAVTDSVKIGTVDIGKTKGQKLAESLGMVVETGYKIYQMDEQNRKQYAASRVNAEQYQWMSDLNNLGSDAEKVQYIQNKVQEVSKPGVDSYYRDNVINTLSGAYNKASAGAYNETQKIFSGQLTDLFVSNLKAGKGIDYENTVGAFGLLDKKHYHAALTKSIEAYVKDKASTITSVEEYNALQSEVKGIMSEYNKIPYAGGSKSVDAVDLQTKLNTSLSSQNSAVLKVLKKQASVGMANNEIAVKKGEMSYDAYIKQGDANAANGLIDEAAWINKKEAMKTEIPRQLRIKEQTDNFDPERDNNSQWDNGRYESEASKQNQQTLYNTLKYRLENGDTDKFIEIVNHNRKEGIDFVKSALKPTGDMQTDTQRVQYYSRLKNSKNGNIVLSNLDPQDRAMLDVMELSNSTGQALNFSELYNTVHTKEAPKLSNTDRDTFNASFRGLPQTLQDQYYTYGITLLKSGMGLSDVTSKIKDLVKQNTQDLGGIFSTTDIKTINFGQSKFAGKSEADQLAILKSVGEEYKFDVDNSKVMYNKATDEYYFYNQDSLIHPTKIISGSDMDNTLNRYDDIALGKTVNTITEADKARLQANLNKKAVTDYLKNPYYEGGGLFNKGGALYKPEKKQQLLNQWGEVKDLIGLGK